MDLPENKKISSKKQSSPEELLEKTVRTEGLAIANDIDDFQLSLEEENSQEKVVEDLADILNADSAQKKFSPSLRRSSKKEDVDEEVASIQNKTRVLTSGAADLIQQVTIARNYLGTKENVPPKMLELQDRLVTELKRQIEYVESLNQMTIARTYDGQKQKKAKRRYFHALIISLVLLLSSVLYFQYGLTESQQQWIMEKSQFNRLLGQKEETIQKQKQEIQHKEITIENKQKDIQEKQKLILKKEEEIKKNVESLSEAQKTIATKNQQLDFIMTDLEVKSYITEKIKNIKDFHDYTQDLLERAKKFQTVLVDGKESLKAKQIEISEVFNQFITTNAILEKKQNSIEENLITMRSRWNALEENFLSFYQENLVFVEGMTTQSHAFLGNLEEKNALFLKHDLKSGGTGSLQKSFEMLEKEHQEQINFDKKLAQSQIALKEMQEKQNAFIKVINFYKQNEMNQKYFSGIQERIDDLNLLYTKIQEYQSKVAQKIDTKELEQNQEKLTSYLSQREKLYFTFMSEVFWDGLLKEAQEDKVSKLLLLQEQKIENFLKQARDIFQAISTIGLSFSEAKNQLEKSIQEQENSLKASPKNIPAIEEETSLPKESPLAQAVFEEFKMYFNMANTEFLVKSSIFSKTSEKLVLKEYTIVKVSARSAYLVLVQTLAPGNQAGNRILKSNNLYWFYDKNKDIVIRVTPNQKAENAINIIDVASISYEDYELKEAITNWEGKSDLYLMKLQAKNKQEFPVIHCLYSISKKLPAKLEYYDQEGKKRYDFYCKSFQITELGKRIQQYIVVDLKENVIIQIEYLNLVKKEIPDYFFDKNSLKQNK